MRSFGKIARIVIILVIGSIGAYKTVALETNKNDDSTTGAAQVNTAAGQALATLTIKGRAPKTGYTRTMFGDGWGMVSGCNTRDYILARDLTGTTFVAPSCKVATGTLHDPYTDRVIQFVRGPETSADIQIDHVVALSDAWQKGAQSMTAEQRQALANDPLELLAVDGKTNQAKGDGDAATWLPPNKSFRCQYIARQIAVKKKYSLWVTRSEYDAMAGVLTACPDQQLPTS